MDKGLSTYKKIITGAVAGIMCFCLAACGPSKEKIVEAQQKYAQLIELNNQVVEAHKRVEDNSLDDELVELRNQVSKLEEYHLSEMKDEEIDQVIGTIDSLTDSYESYLAVLLDIRGEEEAAVLTTIPITLTNRTELSFSEIGLYEKGSGGSQVNILEEMDVLNPERILTGLAVKRDVDNTPWLLSLKDTEGAEYEIELPVEAYHEEGVSLALVYDGEQEELTVE